MTAYLSPDLIGKTKTRQKPKRSPGTVSEQALHSLPCLFLPPCRLSQGSVNDCTGLCLWLIDGMWTNSTSASWLSRVLWLRAIFWILTYANYNQLHTRPALCIPSHEVSRTSSIISLLCIPLIMRTTEQTMPCLAAPLCQGLSVKKNKKN